MEDAPAAAFALRDVNSLTITLLVEIVFVPCKPILDIPKVLFERRFTTKNIPATIKIVVNATIFIEKVCLVRIDNRVPVFFVRFLFTIRKMREYTFIIR